jgi:mannosyltransferase
VRSFRLRPEIAWLLVLTLAGLALRVLFAQRSGLWRDEAQLLWIVRAPTPGAMLDFLREQESHPPLFYFLVRGWLAVFGDSEAAALALSIGLGCLLIPAMFFIGSRVFSPRVGMIAAILSTFAPSLIWHSALVRPYSLLPLLCICSCFFLWQARSQGGIRPWAAYGITTLAMLFTHNWAWLVFGAQWVVFAAWLFLDPRRPRTALLREWALAQAAIGLGYLPWLPTLLYQSKYAGYGADAVRSLGALAKAFSATLKAMFSLPDSASGWGGLLLLAFAGGVWWLAAAERRKSGAGGEPAAGGALLLFVGVPLLAYAAAFLASAKNNLLIPRCLVTVAPCVLLGVARGLAGLSARTERLPRTLIGTALLAGFYAVIGVLSFARIKSDAREVAAAVASRAQPGDSLLISPDFLAASFNYYYKPDNDRIGDSPGAGVLSAASYNAKARRDSEAKLARIKARVARAHREGRRVWYISERSILEHGIDPFSTALYRELVTLYGPPDTTAVSPDDREGDEILTAMLFESRRASAGKTRPNDPDNH